jgi:colicin import membrane protein
MFLDAAKAAVANPETAARLLALAERAENATEQYRLEQAELALQRSEHARDLARASQEHAERLQRERAEWAQEASIRRKALEAAEHEAERRRDAEKDRQQVAEAKAQRELAALQRQWERNPDELMRKIHELVSSRLDSQVAAQAEQRPTAA